jgi:hypothetical protein
MWLGITLRRLSTAKVSLIVQELMQHKPWFDEECLNFLHQKKQAKMQWVQDPCKAMQKNYTI